MNHPPRHSQGHAAFRASGSRVPGFVDIHCHILPGIDDGAPDWETTRQMAATAAENGIRLIVATPHQLGNYRRNRAQTIRTLVNETNDRIAEWQIPLRIAAGADVRIEPDMLEKLADDEVVTLADHRRHVLLELPHEVYFPLEGTLRRLEKMGMVGILSHPERNAGIMRDPRIVDRLVERGCLMQLTAASLTGTFGESIQRLSEVLLKRGVIHFIATDAHGVGRRRPVMQNAFARAAHIVGPEGAQRLCCENPAQVARGEPVDIEVPIRRGFWDSFFRRRAG